MRSAKVCSSPIMKFSKTIHMEDTDISKEETITNQTVLHNLQLTRSLPNILRGNSTMSRNRKRLNKTDSFSTEDGNTSLELNTTLSSVDLDTEANCNKTASPKSHHQRKQVHNPLDIQYDIPDCNNNKNKNVLPKVNQLITLDVSSSSREKNTPTKRLKSNNKQKKSLLKKKLKKITARKSDSRTQMSHKEPDTLTIPDSTLTIPDVNMKNTLVVQTANNFFENDILPQPVYDPNFPNMNANDLNDIATRLSEPSNTFYCEPSNTFYCEPSNTFCCEPSNAFCCEPSNAFLNEVYNLEKYDVNLNNFLTCKSTEINIEQLESIQKDLTSYEFPIADSNLQPKLRDSYIGSNFLYGSKILCPCSCANCMSRDKDIEFYEDPISTSTSSDDTEAGLFTCDLYTNMYDDFYINNYFHMFDNLMDSETTNLPCEEFGGSSLTKENASTDSNSTTELIESSANVSSINQNESQNLQPGHIDRMQDICVESYPTERVTYPNISSGTVRMENVKVSDEIDTSNYLSSESFSTKGNQIISQDEIPIQNAISSDVPVSDSKCHTPNNKNDLRVIQCPQCGKLFNKKLQFWKHFNCCYLYKENFKCICGKMYRHKSSLAQHLRLAHNLSYGIHEKYYICTKCSKSYVRYRAFEKHVLLHDDVKFN